MVAIAVKRRQFDLTRHADCPATCDVGEFVRITGPSIVGRLQVDTVNVQSKSTMPAVGVVISKSTPTACVVRVGGEYIPGIALSPGRRYFVGLDAKVSLTIPPVPLPGALAFVQYIGTAIDATKMILSFEQIPIVRTGD